jgi:hypothetical protein
MVGLCYFLVVVFSKGGKVSRELTADSKCVHELTGLTSVPGARLPAKTHYLSFFIFFDFDATNAAASILEWHGIIINSTCTTCPCSTVVQYPSRL